jgi:hypothetical protein
MMKKVVVTHVEQQACEVSATCPFGSMDDNIKMIHPTTTYRPIRPNPLIPMPVTIFNEESLATAPFTAEPVKLWKVQIGMQTNVV